MNILFTGIGRRVELVQAFRDAALVLNIDLKIYGADMSETAPALAYCDFSRTIVSMKDDMYIQCLLDICKSDSIDLVIPTIDTDLLVLSENKEKFDDIGTKVLISSPDKIRICRDKNNTSSFFIENGLCAPLPVNDWKRYQFNYPAFIKPKDGSSSINAFKAENEKELEMYASQIIDYVIQPYIDGTEYTIDIFCDWDGKPLSIVPRERLQVRAGEVVKTRINMDQLMIEESKKLCKAFMPCGPITVQLIREKDTGIDYFIEINPRFGGGAPLSMKAGARSAEIILKKLDRRPVEYVKDISDGMVFSRFEQSVYIGAVHNKIDGIIFDLDDTLYGEKEYIKSGYKAISNYLGGNYEERLWNFFEARMPAIDCLLKEIGRENEKKHVLDIYRKHKPNIHFYEGVSELFNYLKQKGKKIGIITDGRPEGQHNKISALGLDELVDDIIITDELGGIQFRKPCDIAFRIMQNRWRIPACNIAYIADNPAKDFQAAKQLNMNTLWFKNKEGLYYDEKFSSSRGFTSINDLFSIL